jgi:hypothetical protein
MRCLVTEFLLEVFSNSLDEIFSVQVSISGDVVASDDQDGKILSHGTTFDGVDNDGFQRVTEVFKFLVVIQLSSVEETSSPSKDGGNRVGGGFLTLLVSSEMTSDGTVSSFSFQSTIGGKEDRGHQTERSVTLSNAIRLDITIVVLASPDETTFRLEHICDHIIDQSVFVPDTVGFEFSLVGFGIDLGKDVLESSVVLLEDSVLGRQVEGILSVDGILERSMSEFLDGIISIVHTEANTTARIVEDFVFLRGTSVFGSEGDFVFTRSVNNEISGSVLITVSVSADNDGLSPSGDELGDVLADDGFSEDSTVEVVSDGTIGRFPHFLKLEFLDSILIGSDGGALNTNFAFLDGLSSIKSDFIVGGISVFHTEIEVEDVEIQERSDEFILDELPDDSGHFITIEFSKGVLNLDLFAFHFVLVF